MSDQSFREAFKPLHIPAHYDAGDSDENKIVYVLAQLGEGTADDVAIKLHELDPSIDVQAFKAVVASVLGDLYEKGLLKGEESSSAVRYNLSKITEANDGTVNPDLLAPGLD
ncbi:hypothetical protein [Mucilaginibacter paludis]|nr:hypothetical protein [Mucilaginibacter paludis]